MAVEIGALRAMLSLNSAAFEKGAKRAQASMNTLQRRLTASADRMKSVGRKMSTRMTLPIVAMGGAALRSSLQTVDAQSKMAQSLQTSTRSMQVLARAADRAGISTGELEQVGRQLTKRLSQATTGTGPAVKALDKLGLKAEDLAGMDLDQKIAVINRAIADQVPKAEQAAVAMALFGDRAGILAGRLDADTIAAANAELERFGVTVTEIEADKIEEANDAISALGLVARGLGNQLAVALAPTLQSIAEWLADMGAKFSALSPRMQKIIGVGAALAAAIGPLAIALGFVATGLAALASPIGLVVLAFGAVAGAVAYVVTQWDKIVEKYPAVGTAAERTGEAIKVAWSGIKKVTKSVVDAISSYISGIVDLFQGDFQGAFDNFRASFESVGNALRTAVDSWIGIIDAIVPGFRQIVDDIISAVSALPERLKQWGVNAIQGFVDGLKEKWAELKASVKSIFSLDGIEPSRKTAKQMGYNLGYDLGDGLGVGFGQTQSALEAQTREYLNSLEQAARDESQTQSPSRKWMELGRDLMDGLGIGIGDNAKKAADAAAKAAGEVGASANKALDSASGGAGSRLASIFSSAVKSANSLSGALKNVLSRLRDMALDSVFNSIFKGIDLGGGGGGIGDLFKNLFSFDGGGFTGSGPRTGGIDGKGGFPAILHPQESVIDHTKGSRGVGGVSVQVNNYASDTETRQTRRRGPNGEEVIIDVVNKGAAAGKLTGVQKRYNLKTQARRR